MSTNFPVLEKQAVNSTNEMEEEWMIGKQKGRNLSRRSLSFLDHLLLVDRDIEPSNEQSVEAITILALHIFILDKYKKAKR